MAQTPLVDESLVEHLEGMFKDRAPDFKMTEKEVWIAAGQVSVVRYLRKLVEKQKETL